MAKAKSKTTYHTFKGRLYWSKTMDPDTGPYGGSDDPKDWKWCTTMDFADQKERDKYVKSGIACEWRDIFPNEEDSPQGIRFMRRHTQKFGNEEKEMGRPKGSIWNSETKSYDDLDLATVAIGNGTLAKVDVEVYPTKKGLGHRLRQISVLDLVPYDPDGEEDDDEDDAQGVTPEDAELHPTEGEEDVIPF